MMVEDPPEDAAEPAREPIIMKKKTHLTMPQMIRPTITASTHLKKSFVLIIMLFFD